MKKRKLWQRILIALSVFSGFLAGIWLLGPVLLPFGFGFLAAGAASPIIGKLQKTGLPRWAATGFCVSALYITLSLVLGLLCRLLCREAAELARSLPAMAQSLTGPMARLEQRLLVLARRFPDGIGKALEEGVSDFFRSGAGLGTRLYHRVFDAVSALLVRTPDIALFLLTAVLSSFMLAAKLPELQRLWQERVPDRWRQQAAELGLRLKRTLGAWFRTQLKLMSVTFLILVAGFLILRTDYVLLLALGISLIDALPVLGSGAVLIPWGLLCFLRGQTFRGVGLLCIYGAAALTRTALEPRMLGKQMGLDPLLTLLALYSGYHFLGIGGMILFPMGALLVKQFCDNRGKD